MKKPAKPHPDFPLFPHAMGQWAKKVLGRTRYFGPWDDPQAALERWLEQRDDLLAGREPTAAGVGMTLEDLADRFLMAKEAAVRGGELHRQTYCHYWRTFVRLLQCLGKTRRIGSLGPEDFDRLRAALSERNGLLRTKVEMQRVRCLFKWAFDQGYLDKPVRYGAAFKSPTQKAIRVVRQRQGSRMFSAAEIRSMLAATAKRPVLRALILLGINCGFGNNDCATLAKSALDIEAGWVSHPRPKTGAPRRAKLWPETIAALGQAMIRNPPPRNPEDSRIALLTSQGYRWRHTGVSHDAIGIKFYRLLTRLGIYQPGRTFYSLRRTFATVAEESGDEVAKSYIMGHLADVNDMRAVYRQRISDRRLEAVADYVHAWVFGESTELSDPPHRR
jgi:integrase